MRFQANGVSSTGLEIGSLVMTTYIFAVFVVIRVGPPPVVVDIGTRLTMGGFAGEKHPKFVFPTVVGYPSVDDKSKTGYYVGQELFEILPPKLVYPVRAGLLEDVDAIQAIYAYVFKLLEVDLSKARLLVTENVFNPRGHKEKIAQMLFHEFGISHISHAIRQVLALYAVGNKDGIVIDFEPDYVSIVPVYKGYAIPHAIELLDPPTTSGTEIQFIAEQIRLVFDEIDSDIHNTLGGSIVLTGSSTTTRNFDRGLLQELRKTGLRSFLKIIAEPNRLYLPWIGGSILTDL